MLIISEDLVKQQSGESHICNSEVFCVIIKKHAVLSGKNRGTIYGRWVNEWMGQGCVIQKQTLSLAVPDRLDYPVKPGNDKKIKNKWILQSSLPRRILIGGWRMRGKETVIAVLDRAIHNQPCHRRA